jgi:hypothetical protein
MKNFTQSTLILSLLLFFGFQANAQLLDEDFSGDVFPPTDWSVSADNSDNWITLDLNIAGGEAPEAIFYYSPQFDGISRLKSPTIATSGMTDLTLRFKTFLNNYSADSDVYTLYVKTSSDGTTWNEIWSHVSDGEDFGAEEIILGINNADVGSDNFQIAFVFDGDSYQLDYWHIDDVVLSESLALDAKAEQINIQAQIPVGDVISPVGVVSNNGSDTITFDVNFTIIETGGSSVYDEIMTVTDLAPFETQNINFPDWISIASEYDVLLATLLTGDENSVNDTLTTTIISVADLVALKPLYEDFSSSTCGPCFNANLITDPILGENEATHSLVKYQVNWPGDGDPYYTADVQTRVDYYVVTYAPTLNVNASEIQPWDFDQDVYDSYLSLTTAMSINIVSAEIDANDMLSVSIDIDVVSGYDAGLTAHIAVVEKLTFDNVANNGEVEFHNVLMKMLPDADGTTLSELMVGTTVTLTETYDMSSTFMETPNDLMVVVFVQDDSDMALIQSENANVTGDFNDFTVTFNITDTEGNEIDSAAIFMQATGSSLSDPTGQSIYQGVYPGTYTYDVSYPGLFDASGSVEVVDENVVVNVELEIPDYLFFEDFGLEIPDDWTVSINGAGDYLYWYDGTVIFFRQSGTLNDLMLVSPAIDVSNGDSLFFALGETSGEPFNPPVLFGTITDPLDSATFVEIAEYTSPASGWEEYAYAISDLAGDLTQVHFAWKHNATESSFFALDYLIITELDISASISEIDLSNTHIYPNPASASITIESDLSINYVTVFNSRGQLIENIKVYTGMQRIDVSNYTPGLYLLQMQSEEGIFTKRITVK